MAHPFKSQNSIIQLFKVEKWSKIIRVQICSHIPTFTQKMILENLTGSEFFAKKTDFSFQNLHEIDQVSKTRKPKRIDQRSSYGRVRVVGR